jgi:hypothetical protein
MPSALNCMRMRKELIAAEKAVQAGAKIDFSQLPSAPCSKAELASGPNKVNTNAFQHISDTIKAQMKECKTFAGAFEAVGSVKGVEAMKEHCIRFQQDLDYLNSLQICGSQPPAIVYQMHTIPLPRVHTHIVDNEIEIEIIRAVNVPLRKGLGGSELRVYIVLDFMPTDAMQTAKTCQRDGNQNLEFHSTHKFSITRDSKFSRFIKRGKLSFTLWQNRFLRKDFELGRGCIMLGELETKSEVHDSFDIKDIEHERQSTGGKLEVTVRLRKAMTGNNVVDREVHWLFVKRATGEIGPSTVQQAVAQASVSATLGQVSEIRKQAAANAEAKAAAKAVVHPPPTTVPAACQQSGLPGISDIVSYEVVKAIKEKLDEKLKPFLQLMMKGKLPDSAKPVFEQLQAARRRMKAIEGSLQASPEAMLVYYKAVKTELARIRQVAAASQAAGDTVASTKATFMVDIMDKEVLFLAQHFEGQGAA